MRIETLKEWFKKRHVWLQEAATRIIEKGNLKDEDYTELYKYCLSQAKNQLDESSREVPIDQLLKPENSDSRIKLKSIKNITGINALSPKKPLNFGGSNLAIIYGLNASGKSGYVRILQHICGTKFRLPLISNVYKPHESEKKCAIEYQEGNESKRTEWHASEKPISDLICVDIFDSNSALSYITNENEVTYEPPILSFFSNLVDVCEEISSKIKSEIDKNPSKKPFFPLEYNNTVGAKWYDEKLSANTTEQDLHSYCSWTEDNKKDLAKLQIRLAQEDSEKKAKEIRKKNTNLRNLIDHTTSLLENLSNQKCREVNQLKKKYATIKKTAKVAAEQFSNNASLNGVGSEIWKQLWHYAKEYSETEAYKGQPFPVISDDALCVLCYQKLDKEAKSRFTSFNDFIKGEAQRAVEDTKQLLENAIQSLPKIPDQEMLKTQLNAAGLSSDNPCLRNLYLELEQRKNQLCQSCLKIQDSIEEEKPENSNKISIDDSNIQPNFIPLSSIEEWKTEVEKIIKDREHDAKQYDEDSKALNRDDLLAKQKELKAKEWLSQQINSIKEEIKRLKDIEILNSAERLTNTKALSIKKSELSEELITEDFVNRFNTELKALKADKIKVEIFRSRTKKGKALHQIRLKDTSAPSVRTGNVLSEGEIRIVALSVFLADVTGGKNSAPFIFDDPISSLDQNFEEAVVQRLVQLSTDRQVVVFTHRLSTLALLKEYSKKNNIEPDTIYIKEESWGTGEPGNTPLFTQNPLKALNILIEKLPQAEKNLNTQGQDSYDRDAKSICSDFRIIIENVIESVLLIDIVKRHRRQIYSTKVKKLSKISADDCNFIDDLMTKYSKLLHSASNETPVNFPDPEQLKEDFESLKNWMKEFEKRKVTVKNK